MEKKAAEAVLGGGEAAVARAWQTAAARLGSIGRNYYIGLGATAFMTVAGIAAGIHAMIAGTAHVYNVTREIPWGLLISTYVFFVVTSTGLCLVSSIGHVFGSKDFMPIAKRAVFLSIATIVAGFTVIFFEIENPFRMAVYNIISPNLTSNIWWMGTLYGAYLFFMLIEFACLQFNRHKYAMYAGFMGVVSGIAAHSNLGAVFGMLHGREFWYGPYMPIYFIASAMMSGCAAIIFFTYIAYKANGKEMEEPMRKALQVTTKVGILMISVILFFNAWKIITGFVGGDGKVEALEAMLTGPYAVNFWGFEVMAGMVAPLILYIASRGRHLGMLFAGSVLMIAGIFVMRYDLVVVGQVVPSYAEYAVNEYQGLQSYFPSVHEMLVTAGGMGLAGLMFLVGEKLFAEHRVEEHEHEEHMTPAVEAKTAEQVM